MENNVPEKQCRKPLRLQGYDYSKAGLYFITICTFNRLEVLSRVVGHDDLGVPSMKSTTCSLRLSSCGECAKKYIESIVAHYHGVFVDNYVIMPNYIHMIIRIEEHIGAARSPHPTNALIPTVIAALKRMVNHELGQNIWQKSYYDHIIRDEADYRAKWNYIDTNPARWADDEYSVK